MTTEIIKIGGNLVSAEELSLAFVELEFPKFVTALRDIISRRGGDQLKLLVDGLEIQATTSAFVAENLGQVTILERVAKTYPFSRWLEGQGIGGTAATREHLCQWWDVLMMMASEHEYVPAGQINAIGRATNLWKATGPLANKMQADPAAYRFLPALLINHPQEVERVLREIQEAEPFLEVLTGERMEDLRNSEIFLGSFSVVKNEEENGAISRTVADALFSVQLILQRG